MCFRRKKARKGLAMIVGNFRIYVLNFVDNYDGNGPFENTKLVFFKIPKSLYVSIFFSFSEHLYIFS